MLYPRYDSGEKARREWLALTSGDAGKTLQSGLIAVSIALIRRMRVPGTPLQRFIDYLTGGADWAFPVVPGEDVEARQNAEAAWQTNLMLLDTGILSIVGDDESDPDAVTQLIADVLRDSLWERQLRRTLPLDDPLHSPVGRFRTSRQHPDSRPRGGRRITSVLPSRTSMESPAW